MVRIASDSQLPAPIERPGVSLRDIITILFRRWLIIVAIALPISIIGGINLFGQAGSYTASARVVVELARVDAPKWNPNGRHVDYNRELNTLVQTANTMPVARAAATTLRDSIPIMQAIDESLLHIDKSGMLEQFLLDGLNVNVVGESTILDFRFTSSRGRISLMAVDAMRKAFLDYAVHGLKNDQAVQYYEEQLVSMNSRIDSLLSTRSIVLQAAGYSSLNDELRYDSGKLSNLEADLLKAEVARRSVQAEYEELKVYLDGDPREFPMGTDKAGSSTLVYWMNTVAKHDDELNSILSLYTEDSGPVKRQRALLDASLVSLKAEEEKYVRTFDLTVKTLREREETLRRQVSEVQQRNAQANEVYRKVSLLDSELRAHSKALEALQTKASEVRMAQFADERISGTMVLSDPSIVSVLTGGTTIVYFVALLIIALALGIISGFVVENLDHRIYSPRDVEENLNLQVFASVSRTE